MKLSKEEKKLLIIDKFFNNFKEQFPTVSYMSIRAFCPVNDKKIKNKENIFPLFFYVLIKESSVSSERLYSWVEGSSDDEYPLYDKNGEYYGYHEVKNFIQDKLPEAFKGKAFYKEDFELDTHNLQSIIAPIKVKSSTIKLSKELSDNNKNKIKRLKI
jgi:hypothetical protein